MSSNAITRIGAAAAKAVLQPNQEAAGAARDRQAPTAQQTAIASQKEAKDTATKAENLSNKDKDAIQVPPRTEKGSKQEEHKKRGSATSTAKKNKTETVYQQLDIKI